jgi:hypothetical protein
MNSCVLPTRNGMSSISATASLRCRRRKVSIFGTCKVGGGGDGPVVSSYGNSRGGIEALSRRAPLDALDWGFGGEEFQTAIAPGSFQEARAPGSSARFGRWCCSRLCSRLRGRRVIDDACADAARRAASVRCAATTSAPRPNDARSAGFERRADKMVSNETAHLLYYAAGTGGTPASRFRLPSLHIHFIFQAPISAWGTPTSRPIRPRQVRGLRPASGRRGGGGRGRTRGR